MSRQRGLGVLFGLLAFAGLAAAALLSPSSGISLGPVDGWIAGAPGIQDDLQQKTQDRLAALGVRDATVSLDGRDVSVELASGFPADLDAPALGDELLRTEGVRTVTFDAPVTQAALPAPDPAPAATPAPTAVAEPTPEPTAAPQAGEPNEIVARVDLGSIQLTGDIQTAEQRAALLAQFEALPDVTVIDNLNVLGVAATPTTNSHVGAAGVAIGSLVTEFASGSVRLSNDILSVESLAIDDDSKQAIIGTVSRAAVDAGMRGTFNVAVADAAAPEQPAAADVVESLDLSGVNFQSGTAQLRDDAFATLDEVAATLSDIGPIEIEVQGHTDDQGGADINQTLSEARAAAVAEYLVTNGVDPSILTAKGYGESEPIDDNQTEQGRAANRRVELIVIEGN